jgi:hypothetical protein
MKRSVTVLTVGSVKLTLTMPVAHATKHAFLIAPIRALPGSLDCEGTPTLRISSNSSLPPLFDSHPHT